MSVVAPLERRGSCVGARSIDKSAAKIGVGRSWPRLHPAEHNNSLHQAAGFLPANNSCMRKYRPRAFSRSGKLCPIESRADRTLLARSRRVNARDRSITRVCRMLSLSFSLSAFLPVIIAVPAIYAWISTAGLLPFAFSRAYLISNTAEIFESGYGDMVDIEWSNLRWPTLINMVTNESIFFFFMNDGIQKLKIFEFFFQIRKNEMLASWMMK